jgi:uncharacterized protein
LKLSVRLTPRAGADRIDGVFDGVLVVRVRASPVDGAANEALVRLLAESLEVPKSLVALAGGTASRRKLVRIDDSVRDRIAAVWPELA